MAVATAASSTGTNERLMQNAVSTSMRLASAARMAEAQAARAAEIRSLEAQRAASRKASADSEKADPDWTERLKAWRTNLQEHLPAVVQDVPVLSALQPAALRLMYRRRSLNPLRSKAKTPLLTPLSFSGGRIGVSA